MLGMKKLIYFIACWAICFNVFAASFNTCKSTYALCTTAKCVPIAGKKDLVSCQCSVKTGYSAGTAACEPVKSTSAGKIIYSRYYPIKSYAVCENDRPWAWCLDKPCVINKKNPHSASCACSVVSKKGKYVVVTNTNQYTKKTCTTDLYSSATLEDAEKITAFLKTQKHLKPYPIKVYNGQ